MNFPENLKYTKDHEWILADGKTGTVGITEHAQGELGDVVFVELPSVGKALKQHDSFGTIEAVKAVSDLYAPIAGTVAEVNKDLATTPELVNKDPYGKGWMIRITIANPQELASLMDAATYRKLIGK
jgi:glycine cleavage system H protein